MSNPKQDRKALRERLFQAIKAVLREVPELEAEKAAKTAKKTARKLARKIILGTGLKPESASKVPLSKSTTAQQESAKEKTAQGTQEKQE